MTWPAWLEGVSCTKPFTLDDARELYSMLKHDMLGCAVDVYWTTGDVVHLRVYETARSLTPSLARDLEII